MAGEAEWFLDPPPDWNMRVPDLVRDCVTFLSRTVTKDGRLVRVRGTGFFVTVPADYPPKALFPYLVTARHVAEAFEEGPFQVQMNRLDGGAEEFRVDGGRQWHMHPDPAVDVAVLNLVPDVQVFKFHAIRLSAFATDAAIQKHGIGTGDEVFIAGLFRHILGTKKQTPIIRVGNLAMMPEEPITFEVRDSVGCSKTVTAEVYLIEARSIGGLSGSPVFVRETVWAARDHRENVRWKSGDPIPTLQVGGGGHYYLLGTVQAHWDIPPELKNDDVGSEDDGDGKKDRGVNIA